MYVVGMFKRYVDCVENIRRMQAGHLVCQRVQLANKKY